MHDIAVNKALSGIFGSISLTSWICLLLPQLITNYKAKSAEGLSMAFLLVWLFGDIANLSGALVTGIAPTAAALAGYFCVSDLVLITQCLYYNMKNARAAEARAATTTTTTTTTALASEDEPLLQQQQQQRRRRSSSTGLPGSQRRSSMRQHESGFDPIRRIVTGEDETPASHPALANALSVAAVYVVGTLGWFLSYQAGAWDGAAGDDDGPTDPADANPTQVVGLALGYLSAVCYLCARVPQIIKNYREKSCEGLALLFFLLSLTGNLTYGASVFCYSQEPAYIVKTIPWLLGSLGTIVEDLVIFYQFRIYTPQRATATKMAVGTAP